jgi:hypothetical protein
MVTKKFQICSWFLLRTWILKVHSSRIFFQIVEVLRLSTKKLITNWNGCSEESNLITWRMMMSLTARKQNSCYLSINAGTCNMYSTPINLILWSELIILFSPWMSCILQSAAHCTKPKLKLPAFRNCKKLQTLIDISPKRPLPKWRDCKSQLGWMWNNLWFEDFKNSQENKPSQTQFYTKSWCFLHPFVSLQVKSELHKLGSYWNLDLD